MTAVTEAPPRILTLDIVRGVAVMGILAMNIVGFAMPFNAYVNPMAFGMESAADYWSWLVSFIFIDGKMRGLFSFLFGASMLLVIDRAEARGGSPARTHYSRMFWLLLFGLAHYYLIWFGDILAGYAMIGMIAYLFRRSSPRKLIGWGIGFVVVGLIIFTAMTVSLAAMQAAIQSGTADAGVREQWQEISGQFIVLSGQPLADALALHQGSWNGLVQHRFVNEGLAPFVGLFIFGWETFGYMLLGMAAFRTGFLTGGWSDAAYRRALLIGYGIGIPAYAAMAWYLTSDGFSVVGVVAVVMAATTAFRPLMIVATAALIVLLTRNGGAFVERIAAAGRTAFTNYLGTSILMTTLFYGYGLGLYGSLSRVELWPIVFAMWAVMLLWSKPWLDRFQYGPFEWLWRSLSRGSAQPMRVGPTAATAAAE